VARVFIALVMLLASGALWSAVYRWTDAEGKVHYGDRPIEHAEKIKLKEALPYTAPSTSTTIERKESQRRLLDLYRNEREEKKKQRLEQKEARKKSKQQCIKAQGKLMKYRDSRAIYSTTEDGDREYYSEEKRERYIKYLKSQVIKWCG